jgi:regulatory protein
MHTYYTIVIIMEKALSLAYRYLSFRPRTVKEVELYLEKKSQKYLFTQEEIAVVIELLKNQGFLNDTAFIKSFITSRNSLKPKGQKILEIELRRLGVSQTDCVNYFSENVGDESELAKKALQIKLKSLLGIDEKKRYEKAISFLLRRGFSYDIARQTYLQLTQK